MANVNINIELDEFSLDDLIKECCEQLERAQKRSNNNVINSFKDLKYLLIGDYQSKFEINNVLDKMKLDHLSNVFNEYTLDDLEKLLPKK